MCDVTSAHALYTFVFRWCRFNHVVLHGGERCVGGGAAPQLPSLNTTCMPRTEADHHVRFIGACMWERGEEAQLIPLSKAVTCNRDVTTCNRETERHILQQRDITSCNRETSHPVTERRHILPFNNGCCRKTRRTVCSIGSFGIAVSVFWQLKGVFWQLKGALGKNIPWFVNIFHTNGI